MGLAVATALAKRGNWKLHLLDMNEERGKEAATNLKATFYKTNVTNYAEFASVFDKIFKTDNRLDFVFANAGIVERWDFYGKHEQSPPPAPDTLVVDINYTSVVYTAYLAQHYFRLSKENYGTGEQNIVMTASCGGFYREWFWSTICSEFRLTGCLSLSILANVCRYKIWRCKFHAINRKGVLLQ
jgi:NAD(P)-dependent dehydrogenase (short-subunit alcohol dehydrogenase family)